MSEKGNTSATTTAATTTIAIAGISSSATAISCHFSKFGIDLLVCFPENLDQFSCLSRVVTCEEGDGCSFGASATCSANTMDVIFVVAWIVIVDNGLDIFHVCKN